HLRLADEGDLEGDLARNVAEDIVVFYEDGIYHGHAGVRQLAELLMQQLPNGSFEYSVKSVAGEFAFLEWTGRSATSIILDGADSFCIRDGKIIAQTIHYRVVPLD